MNDAATQDRSEILAAVTEIIAKHLPPATPPSAIVESAGLIKDLHINSVRVVDLIIDLEDRFGLLVEDAVIDRLRRVGEIVDYIAHRLAAGN